MDENASRAVFIGVSVFVSIITISLIINFYDTAKSTATMANRHDIANADKKYIDTILESELITGRDLRHLMEYYWNDDVVTVYMSVDDKINDKKLIFDNTDYYSTSNTIVRDSNIRPNYFFDLEKKIEGNKEKIIATFRF